MNTPRSLPSRWILAFALLLGLPSLELEVARSQQPPDSATSEKTLETWGREFRTGDESKRKRAVHTLISAGTPGIEILSGVLSNPYDEHWKVCMEILVSLDRLESAHATADLNG